MAALRDVTFASNDGDILVIFGPPGAGKSTLLRALAGLEPIDRGDISLGGRSLADVPTHRRNVAMAFESYALYPHFTVRKNLEFPLKAPGTRMGSPERKARLNRVAELLQILPLLDRYPHELSGGQRQRVSLGRALIRNADATLLDEPLAHLDAQLRSTLRGDLRLYLKETAATTLYATPDFQEGFGIANKVLVLIAGVIHQIGTPEDVFANPADAQVAALVGDPAMNLIATTPDGVMQLGQQRLALPVRASSAILVGFRPGAVLLLDPNRSDARVKGRVVLIEHVGSSLILDLDVDGVTLAAKVDAPTFPILLGETVGLDFRWSEAHFFGRDSARITPESIPAVLAAGGQS
jgi:multiple sugar transport system ATP-binding protein